MRFASVGKRKKCAFRTRWRTIRPRIGLLRGCDARRSSGSTSRRAIGDVRLSSKLDGRALLSAPLLSEPLSTYITKLVESLPPALRGSLPSPEALEAELKKDDDAEG